MVYHRVPDPRPLADRALAAAFGERHAVALPALSSGTGVPLYGVEFSPDGERVYVRTRDREIVVWDPTTRAELPETQPLPEEGPCGLEFPLERGPAALWTWDGRDGPPSRPVSLVRRVTFTPDGRRAAWIGSSGWVRLWNAVDGGLTTVHPSPGADSATTLAYAPDGRLLASAGADGTVRFWDAHAGGAASCPPLTGHTGAVRGVAFAPDGSLLAAAGEDGTLRLWMLPGPHAAAARPR
ncbi:hypothetical protein OG749_09565 [Streptomyces nojiriensis]|uniref:WD40 repeat domain-containing protein n=1 Tax=Streptomyces nojiriensis TaxID=66374 RepID=UPI002E1842C5